MKILIVDDDPIMRRLLPAFCKVFSKDCEPLTAKHGEEALQILASENVDIILTDVEMPVMDGCELVAAVKEQYPDTKIIVMTGLACDSVEKRLRDVGIFKYIEKPFTVKELASSIQSAFRNNYERLMLGGISYFM